MSRNKKNHCYTPPQGNTAKTIVSIHKNSPLRLFLPCISHQPLHLSPPSFCRICSFHGRTTLCSTTVTLILQGLHCVVYCLILHASLARELAWGCQVLERLHLPPLPSWVRLCASGCPVHPKLDHGFCEPHSLQHTSKICNCQDVRNGTD